MFSFFRYFLVLFSICPLVMAGEQTPIKCSSTVSITIRAFSSFDSSGVKNYAAALYDSSGTKIDSLVAVDTNVVSFSSVPITGVNNSSESPTGYFLGQNYPNPFNPSSRIKFTIPQAGPVSFKTYTILGQEDASLDMTLEPGNYEVQYNPGGAAGVIFYRLITNDFTETKKMIQFGGEKSGRSSLTLVGSAISSRSERSGTAAEFQANNFMVKLYNLPATNPPIVDMTLQITGLMKDTTVTVYLANACPATVSYEGKTYNTVLIGTQCWLKENLDVGTIVDSLQNQINNGTIEKYCYHNNPANCAAYGGLYQWNEAMQYTTTPGTQGICPAGWHIPTYAEFDALSRTVGGDGNALKAGGQGSGSGAGTNTSGFSALLAGYRIDKGSFSNVGNFAYVWSSTEYDAANAWFLYLYYYSGGISLTSYVENAGFSVHCIKD